jgi:signal transduction histidine kinase
VRVYAHETVEFVFENLVENAIEHNTSASPEVEITVSRTVDDEWVRVQIADNGPGIPDGEVEVLEEGYETAIHHASGIGLWITNWLVSEMDGDLRFTERDPTGTVVTVSLRATPQEDTAQSDSQLPSGSHR